MDLSELFESLEETRELPIAEATAEARVAFDEVPGGKRNHDLLVRGQCAAGLVVGLEATTSGKD